MKKLLLWNPYLDTCGGGEKHVLQICMQYMSHGYELSVSWDTDISRDLERKLDLHLPGRITWVPKLTSLSMWQRWQLLRTYDLLIYVTDGSYFWSSAARTMCFCMVPKESLYTRSILNILKTYTWRWICNSHFTRRYLSRWGIKAQVVYPTIDIPDDRLPISKPVSGTSLTFLTVGRFFRQLHSKRHDVAITWFIQFIQQYPQYAHSKLLLIGGLKDEDRTYYSSLKKLAQDYPNIIFKPNVRRDELKMIYRHADIYLHFAGWQIKESTHPERTEHLGITPLEAMSYGNIPFCHAAGGIGEVVTDGVDGYTFRTLAELTQKVLTCVHDPDLQTALRSAGVTKITSTFSSTAMAESLSSS